MRPEFYAKSDADLPFSDDGVMKLAKQIEKLQKNTRAAVELKSSSGSL